MAMIAFTPFVIISHDAFAVHDQRETIFEMMAATGNGCRHMPQNCFEKRRVAYDSLRFFDQHCFHVVFDHITFCCCQEQRNILGLRSKASTGARRNGVGSVRLMPMLAHRKGRLPRRAIFETFRRFNRVVFHRLRKTLRRAIGSSGFLRLTTARLQFEERCAHNCSDDRASAIGKQWRASEKSASRRPQAGISGILDAQGAEPGQPQALRLRGPKGKQDRLPPLLAFRFVMGGRGASRGGAQGAPLVLRLAACRAAWGRQVDDTSS